MKESNTVELCKKLLKEKNVHTLLIPESIENLSLKHPEVVCNHLTEGMADAIMKKDVLLVNVQLHFGGMVHEDVKDLISTLKDKDKVIVHHYGYQGDKNYYTSVVEFRYKINGCIVFGRPKRLINNIACNSIIAIAKVLKTKAFGFPHQKDDSHSFFLELISKVYVKLN